MYCLISLQADMLRPRVLIVEDETIVALDLSERLRSLGYDVVGAAGTAAEAIDAALTLRPDLILMDVHLRGEIDGVEAARTILSQMQVPIIFLITEGDAPPAGRYLAKPFDEKALRRVLDDATREEAAWSDERFHLLVDSVIDYLIVLLDDEARITSWNPGAERITGYTAEEMIGQPMTILFPPEMRDEERIVRELELAEKMKHHATEGWRMRKDGSRFWAEAVGSPGFDHNGELRGFAVVIRDVTERHALEAQLLQSQKLESLGKLAGGVAHDFNNMLMVIFSRVDILRRLLGNAEPQRRYIEDIRTAAGKSRDLTQQLLASARQQVFYPQITDLNEVVRSTTKLLAPRSQ